MRNLNPSQIRAMARLNRNPDFEEFVDLLQLELELTDKNLRASTEPHQTARFQGRALMLDEILTRLDAAPEQALKL